MFSWGASRLRGGEGREGTSLGSITGWGTGPVARAAAVSLSSPLARGQGGGGTRGGFRELTDHSRLLLPTGRWSRTSTCS